MANLTFVANASPTSAGKKIVPFDEIPQDIRNDAEEVYKALKASPVDGRMHVEFPSVGELLNYLRLLDSYCQQRPEELGGPLRFRKSPARKLPQTAAEFRIVDPSVENDKATDDIKTAVDKVKEAAKK